MAYIYLLESLDEKHRYLGSTPDVDKRLDEHNRGLTKSTRHKGPWKLIDTWNFTTLQEARSIEYRIKHTKTKLTKDKINELVRWFKKK